MRAARSIRSLARPLTVEVPAEAARLTRVPWVPWLCDPASRRVCPCSAERLDDKTMIGRRGGCLESYANLPSTVTRSYHRAISPGDNKRGPRPVVAGPDELYD